MYTLVLLQKYEKAGGSFTLDFRATSGSETLLTPSLKLPPRQRLVTSVTSEASTQLSNFTAQVFTLLPKLSS